MVFHHISRMLKVLIERMSLYYYSTCRSNTCKTNMSMLFYIIKSQRVSAAADNRHRRNKLRFCDTKSTHTVLYLTEISNIKVKLKVKVFHKRPTWPKGFRVG